MLLHSLEQGALHYRNGQLDLAEQTCHRVLQIAPNDANALHLLGVVSLDLGRAETAVGLLQKAASINKKNPALWASLGTAQQAAGNLEEAIKSHRKALHLKPDVAQVHFNLAIALRGQGKLKEALVSYRRAVGLKPDYADAWNSMGIAYAGLLDWEQAVGSFQQAIKIRPDHVGALKNLGEARKNQGQLDAAIESYRRAIEIAPSDALLHHSLAKALFAGKRFDQAVESYKRALAFEPDNALVCNDLGLALVALEKFKDAISAFEKAARLDPQFVDAMNNLGVAQTRIGNAEEAIPSLERAIAMKPGFVDAHYNLAHALFSHGDFDEAKERFQRATSLDPEHGPAHLGYALILLLEGRFERGWEEYEWRIAAKLAPKDDRVSSEPDFSNRQLRPDSVLVVGEQGLGDQIMFCSMVPDLLERCDKIVIECDPKLTKLLARSFRGAAVVEQRKPADPVTFSTEKQIRMGSLGRLFRPTQDLFPRRNAFLYADPRRTEFWRTRLSHSGVGLKVGISWRGGTNLTRKPARSIPLEQWARLLGARGMTWVNLQYGERREEIEALRANHGIEILDFPEAIEDYDETAALVSALDLVISVQTAVIHLAGALGKPVWVLVPAVPEWRYGLDGESMAWYPSVRLFRQPRTGEWNTVLERVCEQIAGLATAG